MKTIKQSMEGIGMIHPDSPKVGDVVECTNPKRRLADPRGYRVEGLGWSGACGIPYGEFNARGVAWGGLYRFSVSEYRKSI